MGINDSRWLYVGVFAIAVAIGLISGMSSSPVVATLIPVLFSLVTGTGLVVSAGRTGEGYDREESTARSSTATDEDSDRGARLGRQLALFAAGFVLGIGFGIGARLYVEYVWSQQSQPAYNAAQYTDAGALSAAIALDKAMIATGLCRDERARLLRELKPAASPPQSATEVSSASTGAGGNAGDSLPMSSPADSGSAGSRKKLLPVPPQ